MSKVIIISGSPLYPSKSSAISAYLEKRITRDGFDAKTITVRDLPAEDLTLANFNSPTIKEFQLQIEQAQAIIIVSPVYKASYPGILKSFLDLIPEKGLENKIALPIVTGGTIAHLLSLEYAFKPVLSVLGCNEIEKGVYLTDSQVTYQEKELTFIENQAEQRLLQSLKEFLQKLKKPQRAVKAAKDF